GGGRRGARGWEGGGGGRRWAGGGGTGGGWKNGNRKRPCRARHLASAPSPSESMRWPATLIVPSVGESSPPMRLSSVVLPEPEGPMSARKSPCAMSRLTWCRTSRRSVPRSYTLLRLRISTSTLMTVSLRFLQRDARAVLHLGRRRAHHVCPRGEPLHQAQLPKTLPRSHGAQPRAPVLDHEDHAVPVALDDRARRHQQAPQRRRRTA